MAGRILVLDDEENYAEMLQDLLRGNDYRVDMATRPERAIAQLEEIPYDLVISDYKMPVMDGADFLKRARELYPNLPFILVSGLMNTPELVKVANMSVTLVMEKPLDTTVFLEQVARFSEPMTEEEMISHAKEPEDSAVESGAVACTYPDEPRFFSAASVPGKSFLQKAWSIARASKDIFIFEPPGGDAELAVKDISAWRGNRDLPVKSIVLADSNQDALEQLHGMQADLEHSNTVCIRLGAASGIPQAQELTKSAFEHVEDAFNLLLVYVLETSDAAGCLDQVGPQGVALPELNERPSDVAAYAARFARIASERSGKKKCSEWTPEAAFLLLAHDWPQGYKEVQEVVMQAVKSSGKDEALSVELLQKALGREEADIPAPDSRLPELMKKAQNDYFEKELSVLGIKAAELAGEMEIEGSFRSLDDLKEIPLLRSDLANL